MKPSRDISGLLAIMAALRTPGTGCPWDLEQDFATIAPFTIEEAYEVADAIARGDLGDLTDELGDLLLQVVFHARMAQEAGAFEFGDVVEAITTKMIRRHPHVFGDAASRSPDGVKLLWNEIKQQEKAERAQRRAAAGYDNAAREESVLDGVPLPLPALTRAEKLQAKASRVGFDWNDPREVLKKIREECDELERELDKGDQQATHEEIGDLLFAVANLARHAKVDPEDALRGANRKFQRRFAYIEAALEARGRTPAQSDLAEMDALWNEAKGAEREGVEPGSPPPDARPNPRSARSRS